MVEERAEVQSAREQEEFLVRTRARDELFDSIGQLHRFDGRQFTRQRVEQVDLAAGQHEETVRLGAPVQIAQLTVGDANIVVRPNQCQAFVEQMQMIVRVDEDVFFIASHAI